jgi:DNA-binding LacI/PurR family transcriptional regulator
MQRNASRKRTGGVEAAPGHVTIKDIASALGVSHSTVSRALNDHSHISDEMKERVRRSALELGYVVNAGARTLRQSNSRLIGIIVPDVMNELFAVMIKVLAARCERAGYQLVLCVTQDDPDAELRHVERLRQSRATGLIAVPTPYVLPETAKLMEAMPVVQFSRNHANIAAPGVAIDGARGVASAVRHLADLGHQRIAYVGLTTDLSTGEARAEGFRSAMERHQLPILPGLFNHGPGTIEYARATTTGITRLPVAPTAIVFGSADLTQGGLEALRREGVKVPADVSIVGFGDPAWFKVMTPAVSTIGLLLSESAEAAISMLLRQIDARETGKPLEPQASLELEPFLILRETTAPPPRET